MSGLTSVWLGPGRGQELAADGRGTPARPRAQGSTRPRPPARPIAPPRTWNIDSASSRVTSTRSNTCFCLTACQGSAGDRQHKGQPRGWPAAAAAVPRRRPPARPRPSPGSRGAMHAERAPAPTPAAPQQQQQRPAYLLHALGDASLLRLVERSRVAQVAVVVKPLLQRGPDGQVRPVLELQRLPQHVRRRVPKGLQEWWRRWWRWWVAAAGRRRRRSACSHRPPARSGPVLLRLAVMLPLLPPRQSAPPCPRGRQRTAAAARSRPPGGAAGPR